MAYARAFVAGFEEDHIDDLITFADAFGASRLRYQYSDMSHVYILRGEAVAHALFFNRIHVPDYE